MNQGAGILVAVTVAFAVLTAVALADVGYLGIFEPHFRSWGAAQVLADLVILAVLSCVWMAADSRRSGVPAWPFVLITLLAGSFGPLLYLIVRARKAPALVAAVA
jgi:uncharacterized membrane protein YqjE